MDEIRLEIRARRRVREYGLAKRRPNLALMAVTDSMRAGKWLARENKRY